MAETSHYRHSVSSILQMNERSHNDSYRNGNFSSLPAYQKLLRDSEHDPRFHEEVKAGRIIGFYRIQKDIGLGNFSRVKLAVHFLAKEKVAIKILDKTKLDDKTQRLLLREITSMERLYHPNIIRLYEVIETPKEIHIVTEYAPGGELYTRILKGGKIPEDQAKIIFAQITAAVDHMHSRGIVHRDIKSENIFFTRENFIKLGDFGFSTYTEKNRTLTTFCGSPPYAAPELYRDENYIGIYVDIWAMGILLFFMVTALMPFRAENVAKLKKAIIDGHFSIPGHVSKECQELICGLLSQDVTERWPISKIRSCSWLARQTFPKEFEPFSINIRDHWISPKESQIAISASARSTVEYQTYLSLKKLGITSEFLQTVNPDFNATHESNRDNINGTYRILLHRIQKQSSPLERDENYDRNSQDNYSYFHNQPNSSFDGTGERSTTKNSNESKANTTRVCCIL